MLAAPVLSSNVNNLSLADHQVANNKVVGKYKTASEVDYSRLKLAAAYRCLLVIL